MNIWSAEDIFIALIIDRELSSTDLNHIGQYLTDPVTNIQYADLYQTWKVLCKEVINQLQTHDTVEFFMANIDHVCKVNPQEVESLQLKLQNEELKLVERTEFVRVMEDAHAEDELNDDR